MRAKALREKIVKRAVKEVSNGMYVNLGEFLYKFRYWYSYINSKFFTR